MSDGRTRRATSDAARSPPRGGAGHATTCPTPTGDDRDPAVPDPPGAGARTDASTHADALCHAPPGGPPEGGSAIGTRTERPHPHDPRLRRAVCAGVRSPGGRRPVAPVRADVGDGLVDESRR